jgi:catechol 2,3-dioxygenase-like lactoylglutathione lyase family enzyme
VPVRGIHHIDLAVSDVEHSLAFYLGLLGPLGVREDARYPSYRGSEEVVYLQVGDQLLGLRRADGGAHHYYDVGIEHLAITVDTREELEGVYQRSLDLGARIHFPPEEDRDVPGYWGLFVFDPDGMRLEIVYWPDA